MTVKYPYEAIDRTLRYTNGGRGMTTAELSDKLGVPFDAMSARLSGLAARGRIGRTYHSQHLAGGRDMPHRWCMWHAKPWEPGMPAPLTKEETDLLQWLGKEDFSQYGECHGKALNSLITRRLAQIHGPGEHQNFIAKGTGLMYRAVSLTDAGRDVLKVLATRGD